MEQQYRVRTLGEIREDDQRLHEIFMKTNPGYIQFHTAIDKIASLLEDWKNHTPDELQEVMVSCGYTEKGAKRRLGAVIKAIERSKFGVHHYTYVDYDGEYEDPIRHEIYRKAVYGDYVDWTMYNYGCR